MATTTLTIGNELLSTTMHLTMDEWRDGLHRESGLMDAWEREFGKGNPVWNGGTRIVIPVVLSVHSSATAMSTGFERIDLSVADVSVPAVYSPAHVKMPVAISGEEEMVNAGEAQIISIAEMRTKATAAEAARNFFNQLIAGGVTTWTGFTSLNGVDLTSGFLEEDAVGSQTNTVGGISKTTYASTTGWQDQRYDAGTSFNSNGLAGMYDVLVEIKAVSPSGPPKIILASRAAFKNLKRSVLAFERYAPSDTLDAGRVVETYEGIPIDVSFFMPNAGTGTTANPISFYFLNPRDIHFMWDPNGYFKMSDFETVSGEYDVRSALITVRGQHVAHHLGSSGLVVDADTF